jgi:hypothetical protein
VRSAQDIQNNMFKMIDTKLESINWLGPSINLYEFNFIGVSK